MRLKEKIKRAKQIEFISILVLTLCLWYLVRGSLLKIPGGEALLPAYYYGITRFGKKAIKGTVEILSELWNGWEA